MTFIRFARVALLAATVSLALTACNTTKFDPKVATHIKSVALQGPQDPPFYIVTMYNANIAQPAVDPYAYSYAPGGAVQNLLTGILLDAGDSDVDAAFSGKLIGEQKLRLGDDLQSALAKNLTGAGYDVAVLKPGSDTSAAGKADARMTVKFLYAGYVDQLLVPYEPLVWVHVTLTDVKTGKTLLAQRYNYSTHTGNLDDVRFDPDKKYDFRSDEELLADTPRAAAGLRAALPLIAADIAAKLKRQP
ncbi:hypothetical protein [Dongia sp.]|uniref:hypothetical protein n=1 Tax=Dongia sp. TaxID=1977262 RepID=UPI0035B1C7FF